VLAYRAACDLLTSAELAHLHSTNHQICPRKFLMSATFYFLWQAITTLMQTQIIIRSSAAVERLHDASCNYPTNAMPVCDLSDIKFSLFFSVVVQKQLIFLPQNLFLNKIVLL